MDLITTLAILGALGIGAYAMFSKGGGVGTFQVDGYPPNTIPPDVVGQDPGGSFSSGGGLTTSLVGTGLQFASAIPVAGIAIAAIGGTIFKFLTAHHQQAVAMEAQVLNNAAPHFRNALIQVIEAAKAQQITADQADAMIDQLEADYYTAVNKIIKGRWPNQDFSAIVSGGSVDSAANAPNPCNGPCIVGHFWVEGDGTVAKRYIRYQILNTGVNHRHGSFLLAQIPAHAGFNGAPAVTINF